MTGKQYSHKKPLHATADGSYRKASSKLARRAKYLNQRAKKVGAEGRVTKNDLTMVLYHYGEECIHCGKELDFYKETESTENEATFDHLKPLGVGGRNDIDNIVPSCFDCNQKRNKQHQQNIINRKENDLPSKQ